MAELELEGQKVRVWKAAMEGWMENSSPRPRPSYFSINASTSDAGKEDLDVRHRMKIGGCDMWIVWMILMMSLKNRNGVGCIDPKW